MSLVEQLWRHVKATEVERLSASPPRITPLELGDLREAINHLTDIVESLQTRLDHLEREKQ
jgi:ubiquinone biosynthesis protein UbiJ